MNKQPRKTILLVEDDALIALAEAQTIEGFGYRVVVVHSGSKAVGIATGSEKPDLILMDIDLGKGMSGPDAAAAILSTTSIPIVFLTSHAEREMVEKVRGITRYGYVIKNSGDFVLQSSIEMAFELYNANELLKGELTERRRTEARLAHSHQLMQYVIQHNRSAIAVHDKDLRYIYVSQRYLDDYNVKEKDVIGKHHYEVFPDLPEKWRDVHRRALAGEVSSAEDDPYVREDGSVDWTRWECRPWYEADGSIGGIIVYTEVITGRKRAEEALHREKMMLSRTERIANIGSWMWEIATDTVTWSDEMFRIFQRDPEEGAPSFAEHPAFYHPDDMASLQKAAAAAVADGTPYELELRAIRSDGAIRLCVARGIAETGPDGRAARLLGSFQDITERKQAEERLNDERNLLRMIINAIPDEIAVKDLERRFVLVNPPSLRALGVTSLDQVIGKRDDDLMAKEFAEISKREEERVLSSGKPILNTEGLSRLDPKTGKIKRAILVSRSPILDRNGGITGLVVINRDITERRRTEDASQTLEHHFRLVWENSTDGMRLTNEEGTIIRVNEAFCRMVGMDRRELEGRSLAVVYGTERQDHVACRHRERFRTRTVEAHFEREVVLWNGRKMWIEVSNTFLDVPGQPSLLLGIFHEITERKQAEARIETLFAEREVLLKEVHHRIKNNMNTMMSLLSLQMKAMIDPGAIAALDDARRRMQSMMVLYDKLYRSERFKELSIKAYLVPLVDQIVGNLPSATTVTIETDCEDFVIQARQLSSIGIIVNELLTNILRHAFNGKERGVITVTASLKEHRATVSVHDDGVGLPGAFDLKTSPGFGLRLVDMLTEQIGGTMSIERTNGTRFILEFDA
jgi:PAS domain S-box-containing protein